MEREVKWVKHRIGKIHNYNLFIELPDNLTGAEHNKEVSFAGLHLERSWKHLDLLESIKETLEDLAP